MGCGGGVHIRLTSALYGGQCSASSTSRLPTAVTGQNVGVGPRASTDAMEERASAGTEPRILGRLARSLNVIPAVFLPYELQNSYKYTPKFPQQSIQELWGFVCWWKEVKTGEFTGMAEPQV
jgi:hypothetical protein